ncbi:MAG TPA: hypothetical protein VGJ73_05115 [Verrucomicrobiae bacterium]
MYTHSIEGFPLKDSRMESRDSAFSARPALERPADLETGDRLSLAPPAPALALPRQHLSGLPMPLKLA